MKLNRLGKWTLATSLLAVTAQGCGKKNKNKNEESSDTNSSTVASGAPTGVGDPGSGEVGVYGQLAPSSSLQLAGEAFNKVLAFQIVGGEIQSVANTKSFDVTSDGRFGFNLSSKNEELEKIVSTDNGDGTYDKAKLSELLGEDVTNVADAEIKQHVDQMKASAEKGGVSWALVSMVASGDRVAEAQSFQFIGLSSGDAVINGLPVSKAKGNLDLGTVSGSGDQAKSALELSTDDFDLSAEAAKSMASASNALKIIKNNWMNYSENGPSVDVTPFYMWSGTKASAKGTYAAASSSTYGGLGMYLGVRNSPFTFDQMCTGAVTLTLTPPADIVTTHYGTMSAANPFNNSGLGAIQDESTRKNCGGSATGFYGAGQTGGTDLMINWGTGGSITTVPEGIWKLAYNGATLANFELASSSPVDASGNSKVFVPSIQLTVDGNNKISRVDVKMMIFNGSEFVEADAVAFRSLISSLNVELSVYGNGSSVDERVIVADQVEGNVFYALGSDFENSFDYDDVTVAVYYEMFGGSYRTELRD